MLCGFEGVWLPLNSEKRLWVARRRWKDNRLLPGFVQFEREDSGVGLEVGVGGEDGPVASDGDSANQDVGDGYDDSAGAAVVAGFGGGFVIGRGSGLIREGAEDCAELFVLAGGLDAG